MTRIKLSVFGVAFSSLVLGVVVVPASAAPNGSEMVVSNVTLGMSIDKALNALKDFDKGYEIKDLDQKATQHMQFDTPVMVYAGVKHNDISLVFAGPNSRKVFAVVHQVTFDTPVNAVSVRSALFAAYGFRLPNGALFNPDRLDKTENYEFKAVWDQTGKPINDPAWKCSDSGNFIVRLDTYRLKACGIKISI